MLYDSLKNYPKEVYPFHMPGHKRSSRFLPPNLPGMDFSEIDGLDNLNAPTGILARLNGMVKNYFSARENVRAEFITDGATCGVLASLFLFAGKTVVLARNSHRSAYGAVSLANIAPVWIQPERGSFFPLAVSKDAVAAAISANPDAAAVFLTSPTYEGVVSDIAGIAEITRKAGKILIVDSAHGAHFPLSPYFPESAINLGADIMVASLHKTMPFMGQSAALIYGSDAADSAKIARTLGMLRTSSPSYVLMAQADFVFGKLAKEPEIAEKYVARLKKFREEAAKLRNFKLLETDDKSKLVFYTGGIDAAKIFREKYRLELELFGAEHCIALTSPADADEGFDRLLAAAKEIDEDFGALPKRAEAKPPTLDIKPGELAEDFIIPYPPGIPLFAPGETITEEGLVELKKYITAGIQIMGIRDGVTVVS